MLAVESVALVRVCLLDCLLGFHLYGLLVLVEILFEQEALQLSEDTLDAVG